jgi:hypothetical protein
VKQVARKACTTGERFSKALALSIRHTSCEWCILIVA